MRGFYLIIRVAAKIFLLLLVFNVSSFSQVNLVNNPSFEMYDDSCAGGGITKAKYWFQPNKWDWPDGGSDFFHMNACDINLTPPNMGGWDFQYPRTDSGFGGGGVFFNNQNIYREYIEVSLQQGLNFDKKYCTSFYISGSGLYNAFTDCIQLIFSVDSLLYYGVSWGYYNTTPHILNPLGNIITDTLNWVLIKGIYNAIGGEKFITIGCFLPKEQVSYTCYNIPSNCGYAYYYYDDFGVFELPEIDAGLDDTISTYGTSAQLQASCTGCWQGLQYRWWPAFGLSDTTILNPVATPTQTTTYYFGLTDTSETVPCIVDLVDSVRVYVTYEPPPDSIFAFSVFPNPATDELTIKFFHLEKESVLSIYDISGRLIYRRIIPAHSKTLDINIEKLADAIYNVVLQNSDFKEIRRFVKM